MYFWITQIISKTTFWIINFLNLGSGYTWPGHIALKIYPNILKSSRIQFKRGVVLISGTNGKTTTTTLITHILESAGLNVIHNRSGANLCNGIVSAILVDTKLFSSDFPDVGVFEVDELALPTVLDDLSPTALVLLNLSRDQLDRYWEIDITFERWKEALEKVDSSCVLIMDSNQSEFKELEDFFKGSTHYFMDDLESLRKTSLKGKFNAKNVNAAVLVAEKFGLSSDELILGLKTFEAAYGRGELIEWNNRAFRILLAKNPASFNNNLDFLRSQDESDVEEVLLLILNDKIPDGRDVSWIYDIDPKLLKVASEGKKIYVSGTRYLDMALRLQTAGVVVEKDFLDKSISRILSKISLLENSSVLALPNYSAMLELRKLLSGKAIL